MGSFFVSYFLSRGYSVTGSDIKPGPIKSRSFSFFPSNVNAVRDTDLVLIASPIETTIQIVEDCLGAVRRGATLIEITSVKGKILPKLRRLIAGKGVGLLSVHPLFGPSLKVESRIKMLVVGGERGEEMRSAKRIFPGATLIPVGEREHDRVVALTLSLTHLVNMLYAKTVSRYMSPTDFRRMATPTAAVQMALAEGVLSNDPRLYSYILVENKDSVKMIKVFSRELKRVSRMTKSGDRTSFEELYRTLRDRYLRDMSRTDALSKIYEAFDSVKE
jgi:chorismate mutase/prephenate dehydrogenase